MKKFMDENFLLSSGTAQKLYHEYAEKMPVLDYHCHISPQEIAEDGRFENIARIWLDKDTYKWRQMRSAGVEERYITGDAPDREKFQKWAQTLEKAVGNPLYHWSHLELKRYFGYEGVLNGETAQEVWDWCNARIIEQDISPRSLLVQSHVTLLCTTDDPADDLKWHKRIREDKDFHVKVLPAWRPEAAMNISLPGFPDYIKRLGRAADMEILTFAQMKKALSKRMDFFHEMGCRISDHSLDYAMYVPASDGETEEIFAKALTGQLVSCKEELKYKTAFLLQTGKEYRKRGWAMQLHYGVKRNNNKKLYRYFGADAGADCIDNHTPSSQLADLLNALDEEGGLPKTILYSLNPSDNAAIDTITGCFQNGECAGKIQHGSAWWFNDHKQGIRDQMISLANLGLLGDFIGMLTDSRSFLSYTRHEYFRRILCDLIGGWVENGEYPNDEKALERLVKDISYRNAVRYFGFDL